MAKNRNYSCSDVNMILASETIAESFKANLSELKNIRTNWTDEYADELAARIDQAIESQLGIDAKKELREATGNLTSVMALATRDLSSFKTQVDEDLKNDPKRLKEIHKNLGFAKKLRDVQNGSQEALIELLYTFKKNMNESLKQEVTAQGMNPVLVDKIIGYADVVKTANVTQESLKGSTKDISQEMVKVLNSIYDEIIAICKIASNFFQYDFIQKEQFTFSKVLNNMNAAAKVSPAI